MKSKTLLIAAASLAAGVMAASAAVYSQNIVGYVNVVLPGNGQYTLIANPLDDGNGNHSTNILSAALPGGTAAVRSTLFYYNGGPNNISKLAGGWGSDVQLPPGVGFYIRNGAPGAGAPDITNTFVGSVVANSGTTVTNIILNGFNLLGSKIPIAGNIANGGTPGGDANLDFGTEIYSISTGAGLSKIQTWNTATQSPQNVSKIFASGNWGSTVSVGVAQGFWLIATSPSTNYVQTVP